MRFFRSVDSTNSAAREWIGSHGTEAVGGIVVADEQTGGRGRFRRSWVTPAGAAVALSIITAAERPEILPQAAGVSVAQAVEPLVSGSVGLKWPNDVEIEGRKVAGILIESSLSGGHGFQITGIGVNVDVDFTTVSGDAGPGSKLALRATSIAHHRPVGAAALDRVELVAEVVKAFEASLSLRDLRERWKALLTTLGRTVTVDGPGGRITGRAVDVAPDGRLVIEVSPGNSVMVAAGDVTVVSSR
ncbi:MAG: biotin--[acetyl-CoA-carboxylase] ligase [Spirochaetaceae bacterium]